MVERGVCNMEDTVGGSGGGESGEWTTAVKVCEAAAATKLEAQTQQVEQAQRSDSGSNHTRIQRKTLAINSRSFSQSTQPQHDHYKRFLFLSSSIRLRSLINHLSPLLHSSPCPFPAANMRRHLSSLARLPRYSPQAPLSDLAPCVLRHAASYRCSQRLFSAFASSSPLLAPGTPTPSKTMSTTSPTTSTTTSSLPSIRKPQRLWTPDYVSPSKHIMNYLTQHGPQTRRTLYAIFGPTPTASHATTPTSSAITTDNITIDAPAADTLTADSESATSPVAAAAAVETAEAIAASTVVQSHPSCLRSKTHLTTLLQQLTQSGRVLTKRAPPAAAAAGVGERVAGGGVGKKGSGLFVYEMRDYETSWNKLRHVEQKGQKQRRKVARLEEQAKQAEELAATRERRRLRLEAGMTTSG